MRRLVLFLALAACNDGDQAEPGPPWIERAGLNPTGRGWLPVLGAERRLEASATASGSRLVVVGGFEESTLAISREVLLYDPFRDTWSYGREAPEAFTHAGLASSGGTIYLLGGLEGAAFTPSGKSWRLGPGADAVWEPLADMPAEEARGAAAVVVSAGHIFLVGGETAAGYSSNILDYAIATDKWSVYPIPLPSARSHAAAMREDDGTFIVAGGISTQGVLGDTWALPLPPREIEPRAVMNTPRSGCAHGVLYGQLVCAGGAINGGVSNVVEVYDPTLDVWTVSTEMPMPRAGAPGAVVTSRLYVVGGSPTTTLEPTGTLLEFDYLDTLPR